MGAALLLLPVRGQGTAAAISRAYAQLEKNADGNHSNCRRKCGRGIARERSEVSCEKAAVEGPGPLHERGSPTSA